METAAWTDPPAEDRTPEAILTWLAAGGLTGRTMLRLNALGWRDSIVPIVISPLLSDLTGLALTNAPLGPAGADALAKAEYLSSLTHLELRGTHLGDTGLAVLMRGSNLAGLTALTVANNDIGDAGAVAVALSAQRAELVQLDLSVNTIGLAGAQALALSPYLSSLRVLDLGDNQIGTEGACALARSPLLGHLMQLNIAGNRIGAAGVRALRGSETACAIQGLPTLQEKRYGYKELIDASIAARRSYVHDDFRIFYTQLFATLQDLFDIHFTVDDVRVTPPPEIHPSSILTVFDATIASYLAIRTPWDGFIEAGLGVADLAQRYGRAVIDLAAQNRAAHRTLLETLFTLLYGVVDQVFTSADLRAVGFDDGDEPRMSDYWDNL